MKSRNNALKHGIFACGLVKGESRAEYDELVHDLMEEFQPEGRLEIIQVEKLAMSFWRYRRYLRAEAAFASNAANEIENTIVDREIRQAAEHDEKGLLNKAIHGENPYAGMQAVSELEKVRQRIEEAGLDWMRDRKLLTYIFGSESPTNLLEPKRTELVCRYHELVFGKEEEEKEEGKEEQENEKTQVSDAEAKRQIIALIDEALEIFGPDSLRRALIKKEKEELAAISALIPAGEIGDKFQRYEGTLERSIDRTLAQLERLQRLRAGLPVPPPVKVEVT